MHALFTVIVTSFNRSLASVSLTAAVPAIAPAMVLGFEDRLRESGCLGLRLFPNGFNFCLSEKMLRVNSGQVRINIRTSPWNLASGTIWLGWIHLAIGAFVVRRIDFRLLVEPTRCCLFLRSMVVPSRGLPEWQKDTFCPLPRPFGA